MSDEATPGRKTRSGSNTRKRGGIIGFRATDAERDRIDASAERAGLSRSSYARACTLDAPQTRAQRRPSIERELLARAVALQGRAIGSLHQIAKHLNFGNVEFAEDIPAVIAELRAAIAVNMAAVGQAPPRAMSKEREEAA